MTPMLRTGTLVASILAAPCATSSEAQEPEPRWDILVSNNQGHSVVRLDGDTGASLGHLVAPMAGGLRQTQEVLVGKDGSLLVAGVGATAVLSFDPRTGEYLGRFTSGYTLQAPTKTRFGPDGHLYVSQWGQTQSSVAVFDGTTGVFIREATPDLDRPMGQAWDPAGILHVVSFGSRDLRTFDDTGRLIDVVIQGDSRILGPVNVWFEDGELMIIDWTSGTIQRYAPDGTHVRQFASGLSNPEGWAYGPDGDLYIAEWTGNRVRRLDPATGGTVGFLGVGAGLQAPNDVFFIRRFPDFSLDTPDREVTVSADTTAEVNLIVRPERGVPFDAPVAVSCEVPTSLVTCAVSAPTVTPGADTVGVVLTFAKGAGSPLTRRAPPGPLAPPDPWAPWLLPILALLCVGAASLGRLPRLEPAPLAISATIAAAIALASCSGSVSEPELEEPPAPPPVVEPQTVFPRIVAEGDGLRRTLVVTVTVR